MRRLAAHVGDETAEHAGLELQHVGGRDVVGDEHQVAVAARRARQPGAAVQGAQHAFDHLFDVDNALAQVLVVHFVEIARNHVELGGQRPFGVVAAFPDPGDGVQSHLPVVEQHLVHVDEGGEFGRRIGRQIVLQGIELGAHGTTRGAQAVDFCAFRAGVDEVVRHVQSGRGEDDRAADGHAAGNGNAKELQCHAAMVAAVRPSPHDWPAARGSGLARRPAVVVDGFPEQLGGE
ncbi:hypothetical protein GALL_552230 [mine drainage metagenome]|uniref:Uncharacterized protein n=1 Tax=mine drainage metagenome TaxID=410659 RepID=A0A1J5PI51_9ZZZZ